MKPQLHSSFAVRHLALVLTLHPEETRVVDASAPGGFDFLGYHFERSQRWPRKKSLAQLREQVRAKTSRLDGRSL